MIHLVAYGIPGPSAQYAPEVTRRLVEDSQKWTAEIVELTQGGKALCGFAIRDERHAYRTAVATVESARQQPRDQLCPACLDAAAKAGRPVPVDGAD